MHTRKIINRKNLHTYKCDLKNLEEISNAVDVIIKKFKKIDVLVNNASLNFEILSEYILWPSVK